MSIRVIKTSSIKIILSSVLSLIMCLYCASINAQIEHSESLEHIDYFSFDDGIAISQSQTKDLDNSFVIQFLDADGKVSNFKISEHQIISGKLKKEFPNHHSYDIQKVNDLETFGKMIISPTGVYVIYHSTNGTVMITPTENDGIYKIEKDWERTHRHGIECGVDHSKLQAHPNYKSSAVPVTNGEILREYELALVLTGEYYEANGNNDAEVVSWVMMHIETLNFIYEKELSATFVLDDRLVIYRDKDTDPFISTGDPDDDNRIALAVEVLNLNFDINEYDLGHVLNNTSLNDDFRGGGLAGIRALCSMFGKNRGWSSSFNNQTLPFMETFAHEIGHMFGANHTFNGTDGSCTDNISAGNSVEIGSGSTLMSYQGTCGSEYNIPRDFFSTDYLYFNVSNLYEMTNHMNNTDCYDIVSHQNTIPELNINPCGIPEFNIPINTPFRLLAEASDADGDELSYCWEQFDEDGPGTPTQGFIGLDAANSSIAPQLRSFPPFDNGARQFPSAENIVAGGSPFEVLSLVPRELNMRMTVRDNKENGGAIIIDELKINVVADGPLMVDFPGMNDEFDSGSTLPVSWMTNGTEDLCDNVDIHLSLDGGQTFDILLAEDVPYNMEGFDVIIPIGLKDQDRAKIKVECADNECFSIFNYSADFTIIPSCENDDHVICNESSTFVSGIMGTPELNLDFTPSFTEVVISHPLNIGFGNNRELTSRNGLDDNCQYIGNLGSNPLRLPTNNFDFMVDQSGLYRLMNDSPDFKIMNVYRADDFDVNDPCPSLVATNASESAANPGSTSTSASSAAFFAELESCTPYTFRGTIFNEEVTMNVSADGPGNFINVISSQYNLDYTYIVVDQNNNIIAISENSDFRNIAVGNYTVFGAQYENTSDPDSWIGSQLDELIYDCIGLSTNSIILEVLQNDNMIEICDNGIDDDMDGDIDCLDSDLANDCCCLDPLPLNAIDDVLACQDEAVLFEVNDNFVEISWTDLVSGNEISNTASITLDMAGVYAVSVVDSCDNMMVDTFGLEFLTTSMSDTLLGICLGGFVELNGETYDDTGDYQQTLTDQYGCDSILNILIELLPTELTEIREEICTGDEIIINGEVYTDSGTYEQILTTSQGCDSILSIIINVVDVLENEITAEICAGGEIIINGEVYGSQGMYQQVLTSSNGCDSLLNITVVEITIAEGNITESLCPNSEIEINGETFNAPGNYEQELTSYIGCDSLLSIEVLALTDSEFNISESICPDQEIEINGETYNTAGDYQQTLTNAEGCDSIINIEIVQLSSSQENLNENICAGDEIEINGEVYTAGGSYTQLLTAANGCDSLLNILITEIINPEGEIIESICEGTETEINGEVYDTEGDYQQSLVGMNGCDSTLNITILELPNSEGNISESFCSGSEVEINGEVYDLPGDYQQTLDGSNGCDSILNITITELATTEENITREICADSEIVINGETYNAEGTYQQILDGSNGCDSLLNITINEVESVEESISADICDNTEVEINGEVYDAPGTYQQTLTSNSGCDSLLNITINELPTNEESIDVQICVDGEIEINGEVYNTAGTYQQLLDGSNGCDSLLNITVSEVAALEENLNLDICAGSNVQINGETYSASGDYTQNLTASNGCDSILNITIFELDTIAEFLSDSFCENGEYEINGVTYNMPGTYQQNFTSSLGCDSLLYIDLTVIPTNEELVMYRICDGDSIVVNDEVFNTSGSYQQLLIATNTCDSILNIEIEIDQTYATTESYAILPGDVITVNGQDYTSSGTYDQVYQTVDGCDSTITIIVSDIESVVHFNLDDCRAWLMTDNNLYTEFTPEYPNQLDCGTIESTILYRDNPSVNLHSCTPGLNGTNALCVGSLDDCEYDKDSDKPLIFEMEITPEVGANITVHALEFNQKAPETFDWINGDSGLNNYPTLFGVRVLINDVEVYFEDNLSTTTDWNIENIVFDDIDITAKSTVRIEMMGYCLIGNASPVSAWDVEDINVFASCLGANGNRKVSGSILTHNDKKVEGVEVKINGPEFYATDLTNEFGKYSFDEINALYDHSITAYKNDDCLNGVSTLDLVLIQKHVLGLKPFDEAYKFIAGDINNNGEVSSIDLIELRKLILGIYDEFPDNTSWRFCDANRTMSMDNPWNMSELIGIEAGNHLAEIIQNLNGIKIGDVNGDVVTKRSTNDLNLTYKIVELENQDYKIDFYSDDLIKLYGFQLGLDIHDNNFDVVAGALPITESNFNHKEHMLYMSWNSASAFNAVSDDVLFSIILDESTNIQNLELSEIKDFSNEAYAGEQLEIMDINLRMLDNNTNLSLTSFAPNPFTDILKLNINSQSEQNAKIEILDLSGKSILSQDVLLSKGDYNHIIDGNELPTSNFYILKITSDSDIITQRILHVKS